MRGGKRAGSGRKKGTVCDKTTRRTQAALAALEQGISPLEVMLDNMRWAHSKVLELTKAKAADQTELAGYRKLAQQAAVDAAPFVHPKLAAVQHSGDDDSPLRIIVQRFTDA